MKKLTLILCCLFALTACDSNTAVSSDSNNDGGVSSNTDGAASEDGTGSDTDSANGTGTDDNSGTGEGEDTGESMDSGEGSGTGESADTGQGADTGEEATAGEGTDSGEETDTGTETDNSETTSSCIAPTHGNIFTGSGTTVLTDGCTNGASLTLSESSVEGTNQILIPGQFQSDGPSGPLDKKGLYLYKASSAPAYILARYAGGFYQRAGRLGFVTGGAGIYYLPLLRDASGQTGLDLNGLALSTWSAIPGQSVSFTEVTWAGIADDVSALPKLHWQDLNISDASGSYDVRNLLTQAASAQPLRELTRVLAESITAQYIDLSNALCPPEIGGFSQQPAIRFTDATGELGQAWSVRDIVIRTADDLARPIHSIAIDWNYASNATVGDILASIDGASYLWPDPARNLNCTGQIIVNTDFDALRPSALNGSLASTANSVWNN